VGGGEIVVGLGRRGTWDAKPALSTSICYSVNGGWQISCKIVQKGGGGRGGLE